MNKIKQIYRVEERLSGPTVLELKDDIWEICGNPIKILLCLDEWRGYGKVLYG